MRNVVVTLLLMLGCLWNQSAWQTPHLKQRADAVRISAAVAATECLFLRTSDTRPLPTIAEAQLAMYVVSRVLPAPSQHSAPATDELPGGVSRTTLQTLDIRLQV